MLFSTSSAIAFSGLLCDRAMILIAFQSSPIRSLPFASAALAMSQSDSVLGSSDTWRWCREITIPVQPKSVHHDQSFFQKVDRHFQRPRFRSGELGKAAKCDGIRVDASTGDDARLPFSG